MLQTRNVYNWHMKGVVIITRLISWHLSCVISQTMRWFSKSYFIYSIVLLQLPCGQNFLWIVLYIHIISVLCSTINPVPCYMQNCQPLSFICFNVNVSFFVFFFVYIAFKYNWSSAQFSLLKTIVSWKSSLFKL